MLGFQEPPNFQHILASGEAENIRSYQAQHKFVKQFTSNKKKKKTNLYAHTHTHPKESPNPVCLNLIVCH